MNILNESMPISRYLKSVNGKPVVDQMYGSPAALEFISDNIDSIFPAKTGKQGLWIFGNKAMPVVVDDVRETSLVLKKPNGKPWEELYDRAPVFDDPGVNSRLILPNQLANIYDLDDAKIFVNLFAYLYIKSNEQISADDFVSRLLTQYSASSGSWVNNKNRFKSVDVDLGSQVKQPQDRSNAPGGEGETFIDLGNGWQWLNLNRGYCADEGAAAGHCGNANPRRGDNILSLRDADNKIHMTVVVDDNGYTTEMKAPGNRKPKSYTHPHVVELLLNDQIKGVGKGRYLPENDFKITDLSFELASKLMKANKLGNYNQTIECALKANGDQTVFAELMKQAYGLQDFDYNFDYNKQAILLDSAPIEVFTDQYELTISRSNQYDSWLDVVEASSFNNLLSPELSMEQIRTFFAAAWSNLPRQYKAGISSAISGDQSLIDIDGIRLSEYLVKKATGKEYGRKVAEPDKNLEQGMKRVGYTSRTQTNIEMFNNENSNTAYYNDGFFVSLQSDGTLSLYINTQGADQQLKATGTIELPESINIEWPYSEDVGLDQFVNALRKDQFWARRIYTTDNKNWSQELDQDQELLARQQANRERQQQLYNAGQHPMQIEIRNEQEILPNLERKYMEGGLEEYIQQLRQQGWWDDYVNWATTNNKFLPVEIL